MHRDLFNDLPKTWKLTKTNQDSPYKFVFENGNRNDFGYGDSPQEAIENWRKYGKQNAIDEYGDWH